MTFTRSVLFASLLTAAAFGCRNRADDNANRNAAPKPVESTTTTDKTTARAPEEPAANPDPWASRGSAAAPSAVGSAVTPESATGTEGSAAAPSAAGSALTPESATGTEGSAAVPEGTMPGSNEATGMGTPGSAMGSTAAPGSTETGSAVPSSTEPGMNAGSDYNTGSATNTGSDEGTLDQRGGALNGDIHGDQSNQP